MKSKTTLEEKIVKRLQHQPQSKNSLHQHFKQYTKGTLDTAMVRLVGRGIIKKRKAERKSNGIRYVYYLVEKGERY